MGKEIAAQIDLASAPRIDDVSSLQGGAEVPPSTVLLGAGAVLGGYLLLANTGVFLELVGVAAAAQLVSKNFLYAKDRQRTTKALRCGLLRLQQHNCIQNCRYRIQDVCLQCRRIPLQRVAGLAFLFAKQNIRFATPQFEVSEQSRGSCKRTCGCN